LPSESWARSKTDPREPHTQYARGIQPRTFKDISALPALKALYQIHYNTQYGDTGNTKPEFIANPRDDPDKGEFIKATVYPGKNAFTLQIGPTGKKRSYPIR